MRGKGTQITWREGTLQNLSDVHVAVCGKQNQEITSERDNKIEKVKELS